MKSKILALGVVFTLMLTGCGPKDSTVKAESVSLDKTSATMVVGDHLQLNATVLPENATDKTVTWSASDTSIVSVENGYVSALKAGDATVTATTVSGGFKATCTIKVNNPVVHVTSVSLDKATATMVVGDELTLTPTVLPANATEKAVRWSVTGDAVSVANGKVTAEKAGEATVKVTTVDGAKEASCVITVSNPVVHVESVSLDKSEATMLVGKELTLTETVLPANADDKSVSWSVTGDAVTVDNGKVTAAKAGEATVTVTTTDGSKTASCTVTVIAHTGITMTVLGSLTLADAAATAYGKADIPVLITLSGDDAEHVTVEVDGSKLTTTYYIYDKSNGNLTIATTGNIGNSTFSVGTITGKVNVNAAFDTIENISVDGSIKDYITNNGNITCKAAWSNKCDYATDAASQAVWQRRYMTTSWQYNSGSGQWTTSNSTYHMEEEHSMGLRIANNSYGKTSFLLKKDINEGNGVKARGVSVWVYNPNGNIYKAFNIFAYKAASTASGDHVIPSSNYLQPLVKNSVDGGVWVNYRVGFSEITLYNFSIYVETNSADTTYLYLGHVSFF